MAFSHFFQFSFALFTEAVYYKISPAAPLSVEQPYKKARLRSLPCLCFVSVVRNPV